MYMFWVVVGPPPSRRRDWKLLLLSKNAITHGEASAVPSMPPIHIMRRRISGRIRYWDEGAPPQPLDNVYSTMFYYLSDMFTFFPMDKY